MTLNIPQQYILQYNTETDLAYQFTGDKLAGVVMTGVHQGEGAAPADYVGPTTANENPARLAPTPSNNAAVTRRWVYPTFFDHAFQIAQQDVTRTFNGGQLQSQYAKNQGLAMSRKRDDLIAAAIFGTAQTGKNGSTAETFPTSNTTNVVDPNYKASANTGLTIAKIIRAKKLLEGNGVDMTTAKLYSIINSDDHEFLLNQIEIRSKEYNERPVLSSDGRVDEYLGIKFIHMEYTNSTYYPNAAAIMGQSTRYVPVFDAAAMYWGNWKPITVTPSIRHDLSEALQLYAAAEGGATRLQTAGIIRVDCV